MDPSPATRAAVFSSPAVPRNLAIPEGPLGPVPVNVLSVALPVYRRAQELLDPAAAQMAELIRSAIAGTPEAVAAIIDAAPPASAVFGLSSGVFGAAATVAGIGADAARLLATPAQGIPYVGPLISGALSAWGAIGPGLAPAFTALQHSTAAVAGVSQQWGQLGGPTTNTGAIPPPPVVF